MRTTPLLGAVALPVGSWSLGHAPVLQISPHGLLLALGVPTLVVVAVYALFARLGGKDPEDVEACPACGATPAADSLYCADCRSQSRQRK